MYIYVQLYDENLNCSYECNLGYTRGVGAVVFAWSGWGVGGRSPLGLLAGSGWGWSFLRVVGHSWGRLSLPGLAGDWERPAHSPGGLALLLGLLGRVGWGWLISRSERRCTRLRAAASARPGRGVGGGGGDGLPLLWAGPAILFFFTLN